jgi:hypothetical protein
MNQQLDQAEYKVLRNNEQIQCMPVNKEVMLLILNLRFRILGQSLGIDVGTGSGINE